MSNRVNGTPRTAQQRQNAAAGCAVAWLIALAVAVCTTSVAAWVAVWAWTSIAGMLTG
ncbi:hydroxyethylthiazole kinase-like sugar kinase family protein [Lipingzhangella halophila]|uniref:Hydroxyethylthiazole kinase-like sugar kinase family protein n=1 Tax=Lipingzhangella halophila TaxID=1783352 RepID=A0A7W7RGU9_9ACTN|nr:hypothetical protein [Lipingzhangella halophila]MBB4931403.1 hydroxyethylthiazole kinase-like sugar kinase family protein [Lipingzhangella halophila]